MTARTFIPGLLCLALLGGCDRRDSEPLLGTLEWDRIGVPAEASETILDWKVAEGDSVQAGQLLVELDPRRLDARLDQARGQVAQAEARLEELSNGARQESIDAARATLVRNRADATEAGRNYQRVAALYARGQVAIAERDRARASRDQADAELQAARAALARLQVDREHLSVRAPRAGRVDALPFRPGDQPPANAEVVSLLVGEAPYARLFIPAPVRSRIAIGDRLQVGVEGVEGLFTGRVRSIASEASFTPYYALTGSDASRLVYRAELVLEGEAAARLPAGLPLHAERPGDE